MNGSGSSANPACGLDFAGSHELLEIRPVVENLPAKICICRAYALLPPKLKQTAVDAELFLNLLGRDQFSALWP